MRAQVKRSYLRKRYPWKATCSNPRHGEIECHTWEEAMRVARMHARKRNHEIRGARKTTPTPRVGEIISVTPEVGYNYSIVFKPRGSADW